MQSMAGINTANAPRGIRPAPPYFSYPYTLSPLPYEYKQGLIAIGMTGLLSLACCGVMLLFVIYRFITWRLHYKTFVGYNQYIVLVINLLLADMMQGIAFTFSFHWINQDGIFAPTETCFAQGFLVNLGDVASGFFVLGIALHTFYGTVKGRHSTHTTFCVLVVSAWLLALLLTSLGPILHRQDYYVRAGVWCWVNNDYEMERLALHYIWIFLVQFGTIIIYALIFLYLKRAMLRILPLTESPTQARVNRAAKLMVTFPAAYLVLTLPLSAGRMWSAAHGGHKLPTIYALVAGSLIGSCGIVDCLLYTLTRRSLLKQEVSKCNGCAKPKSYKAPAPPSQRPEKTKPGKGGKRGGKGRRFAGIVQTRTITIITSDRRSSAVVTPDLVGSAAACSSGRLSPAFPTATTIKSQYPWSSVLEFDQLINPERTAMPAAGIVSMDPLDAAAQRAGSRVEIRAIRVNGGGDDDDDDDDADSTSTHSDEEGNDERALARSDIPYSVGHVLRLFWKSTAPPPE